MAVSLIMTGIVPYQQFLGVDHPVSLALQRADETWFAGFVDLGAIVGMTTVILVMAYGQTRIIFAMSRDGLLPRRLSSLHPRHGTPFLATWLVGGLFGLIAALLPLNVLAELINIGTLAAFCLIAVAVIVLRKTRPDLPRAFRCPGVPVVPLLAIGLCVTLMTFLQPATWIAFRGEGPFPHALQNLWAESFSEWFPSNPYRVLPGPSLLSILDTSEDGTRGSGELWMPVERAS